MEEGRELVRFESLDQKDKRNARVFATGDVVNEYSEEGVETSEEEDCAEWENRERSLLLGLKEGEATGVMCLICSSRENWTWGPEDGGWVTYCTAESRSSVSESDGECTKSEIGFRGDEIVSIVVFGNNEGRATTVLRDEIVLRAILARPSSSGIAVTPPTLYTAWVGSKTSYEGCMIVRKRLDD